MPTVRAKGWKPGRAEKAKRTRAAVNRVDREWWGMHKRKASSMRLCARCNAVYFDGHWHDAPLLSAHLKVSHRGVMAPKAVKEDLCDVCRTAVYGPKPTAESGFEGQVILDGLIDPKEKAMILATVRNFGKRASKRDPEDRILLIEDRGERVVVTTSENQMAAGIGRAVDAAFKGGKLKITWSDTDLPVRVHWIRKA